LNKILPYTSRVSGHTTLNTLKLKNETKKSELDTADLGLRLEILKSDPNMNATSKKKATPIKIALGKK